MKYFHIMYISCFGCNPFADTIEQTGLETFLSLLLEEVVMSTSNYL